jgi:hypothetical protein
MSLFGSDLKPLPLGRDPGCRYTAHVLPEVLADGRISYLEQCYGTLSRLPDRAVSLMAYDPRTGSRKRLRPYYLPFGATVMRLRPTCGSA